MKMAGRIAIVAVLVGALAGGVSARDRADGPAPAPRPGKETRTAQEAKVVAVLIDPATQNPVVVLEGTRDHRTLTMAIGLAEATGIAIPLQGVTPPRPLTHDLFLTLFGRLKVSLHHVVINDVRNDTYFATVHLAADGTAMTLDSRPSDAIALAIRARVPVLVEDRVFDRGGAPPATSDPKKPSI
jgi:bifunctional DNase/RNase